MGDRATRRRAQEGGGPPARAATPAAEEALRTDTARQLIARWNDVGRDVFRLETATREGRDLAALEDDELSAHLDPVQELMKRGQQVHMLLC